MVSKINKKLVVILLTAVLLISSTAVATASTVCRNSNYTKFVYSHRFIQSRAANNNNIIRVTRNSSQLRNRRIEVPAAPVQAPNGQANAPVKQEPVQAPTPQRPAPQPVQTPPAEQPASNARHSLSSDEIKFAEYVNKARTDAGLKPLIVDVDLSYVARIKSKDMHDNKYFSHTSPTYGSPFDMMRRFGIQFRGAGENIAKMPNVESAHNGLMNSQGHRANILNTGFTHIGVGIYNGYYTQMFISK